MKNNNCFYCLNQCEGQLAENTGWYYPCKLGIQNEGLQNVKECPSYSPNTGFQIGGYYSHIHFEYNKENPNECFEKAKAMEKEQIENAFNYGQFDLGMEADEYYNKTFKSE